MAPEKTSPMVSVGHGVATGVAAELGNLLGEAFAHHYGEGVNAPAIALLSAMLPPTYHGMKGVLANPGSLRPPLLGLVGGHAATSPLLQQEQNMLLPQQ